MSDTVKLTCLVVLTCCSLAAAAGKHELVERESEYGKIYGYKDTPLLPWTDNKYCVHDADRPVPKHVETDEVTPAAPPDGAIVLFDGTHLNHWRPSSWKLADGCVEAGKGSLETKEAFGRIDVLVANAGIYGQLKPQPFDTIDPDEWDWVMSVNLKGPFLSARAVMPCMREQKSGNIIIVSSVFWVVGRLPCMHYAVSKAGEMGMLRQMAHQVADDNIRANALMPGGAWDEATEKFASYLGPGAADLMVNELQLLHRKLMPEDLVGGLVYLASDESDMMTGQGLAIDGGLCFY